MTAQDRRPWFPIEEPGDRSPGGYPGWQPHSGELLGLPDRVRIQRMVDASFHFGLGEYAAAEPLYQALVDARQPQLAGRAWFCRAVADPGLHPADRLDLVTHALEFAVKRRDGLLAATAVVALDSAGVVATQGPRPADARAALEAKRRALARDHNLRSAAPLPALPGLGRPRPVPTVD